MAATALIYTCTLLLFIGMTSLTLASLLPQTDRVVRAFPQQTQGLNRYLRSRDRKSASI
jgi:hypothetical protein